MKFFLLFLCFFASVNVNANPCYKISSIEVVSSMLEFNDVGPTYQDYIREVPVKIFELKIENSTNSSSRSTLYVSKKYYGADDSIPLTTIIDGVPSDWYGSKNKAIKDEFPAIYFNSDLANELETSSVDQFYRPTKVNGKYISNSCK
jgi:hypothetical protein